MSASIKTLVVISLLSATTAAQAAIALDRTRVIFPGSEKSTSVNIANTNVKHPYLAQAWLEDMQGNKIASPFVIVPPMQRVEPDGKSTIRINALPAVASLPQDRESVFMFNVREVPPRSDTPNTMQIALQSKIKLFYRPEAILPERYARWDDKLVLNKVANGYRVENPTPYYMTVIAITGAEKATAEKNFKPQMIEPKSSAFFATTHYSSPWVTTINDYGGKPAIPFTCSGDVCHGHIPEKGEK